MTRTTQPGVCKGELSHIQTATLQRARTYIMRGQEAPVICATLQGPGGPKSENYRHIDT